VQIRIPRLFTVRVMVLGVVTMLAFVLVFPTLRSYLQQREELRQLNAQVVSARAHNDDLTHDLARWNDPAYVIAQARDRLDFVMPGETAYRVEDPATVPDTPATAPSAASAGVAGDGADTTEPWYKVIWSSVQVAGAVPASGAGHPAAAPGGSASAGTSRPGQNGSAPAGGASAPAGGASAPAGAAGAPAGTTPAP
jgi:cell division protein FtsB